MRSLCGKGILKADEEQKYEMDKTLELLLAIAEQPYGCFSMEDLRNGDTVRKTVVYFRDDVIGAVEQTGELWEFLWIPYLTLAIGETANLHEPFLNAVTERPVVETDGSMNVLETASHGSGKCGESSLRMKRNSAVCLCYPTVKSSLWSRRQTGTGGYSVLTRLIILIK
mgnify:CR=1 FL=1